MGEQAAAIELSAQERELGRLRCYLLEWRAHYEAYAPRLGAPDTAGFLAGADIGVSTASEWLERSDKWAMQIIDRAVEDLRKREDGHAMRAALMARLMNLSLPARVIRHGRLLGISAAEVDALADRAERALVDIVKLYGLPL